MAGLKRALVRAAKEAVWAAARQRQGEAPSIALFSSRRGGSTLLMEVIAANPRMGFADQPFGLYTASEEQIARLPLFAYGQVLYPDAEEWGQIEAYIADLLAGRFAANGPWRPGRHHLRTDRMVLKITDAKSVAGELCRRTGLLPLAMIRHPIAQALSVERRGWALTGRAFLRSIEYRAAFLGEKAAEAEAILAGPDRLAARVLDWTLENLPLLADAKDWPVIAYERLVTDPEAEVDRLAAYADLPDTAAMLKVLTRPSRSAARGSTAARRAEIAAADARALVGGWRDKVDPAREAALLAIPQRFGLDLYRPGADMPVL